MNTWTQNNLCAQAQRYMFNSLQQTPQLTCFRRFCLLVKWSSLKTCFFTPIPQLTLSPIWRRSFTREIICYESRKASQCAEIQPHNLNVFVVLPPIWPSRQLSQILAHSRKILSWRICPSFASREKYNLHCSQISAKTHAMQTYIGGCNLVKTAQIDDLITNTPTATLHRFCSTIEKNNLLAFVRV